MRDDVEGSFFLPFFSKHALSWAFLRRKEMSQNGANGQDLRVELEQFKPEAMLLAGLMHPNLPRIYDSFTEDGRWYLVMDFIEGQTLDDYLEQTPDGKLPLQQVLEIGIQLCSVLDIGVVARWNVACIRRGRQKNPCMVDELLIHLDKMPHLF